MMDEWGSGYSGGGGAGGALMMGLFWVLVIAGIVVLVIYVSKKNQPEKGTSVLDILKARYAKGEIDKAEFDQKRKDLKD
jgi:putative membrane protein